MGAGTPAWASQGALCQLLLMFLGSGLQVWVRGPVELRPSGTCMGFTARAGLPLPRSPAPQGPCSPGGHRARTQDQESREGSHPSVLDESGLQVKLKVMLPGEGTFHFLQPAPIPTRARERKRGDRRGVMCPVSGELKTNLKSFRLISFCTK